ncbi:uncharacterized protein LOC141886089 [Acropora palmata]|uniref:uncharacterized protein LOC141886089 n=1 Tax=Acropora palmata TaxID=6131 RepID=UPI003DA1C177
MWNQVEFWFAQMMCYNVYIPFFIRRASDVEENPGPTIFNIIDQMRTFSADYSQRNEALFGENAGKCKAPQEHQGSYAHDANEGISAPSGTGRNPITGRSR